MGERERAGYTVTMFLIDVSPSMGKTREVELHGPNGETVVTDMTNLEWSLQYVKLKIQEMIFNGRKTDQCGVILFGTEDTNNVINEKNGGYEHVTEYIPIGQPNAGTIAKLAALRPSTVAGDPIDGIIVGVETQDQYLKKKPSWSRKMVLLTDGESPMEIEDWEATVKKINTLKIHFIIVGVDFDEEELGFHEENKSNIKRTNEEFYRAFVLGLDRGVVGNCQLALEEIARPEMKQTKSALLQTKLTVGDTKNNPTQAISVAVRTSKCTAVTRPQSFKLFAMRGKAEVDEDVDMDGAEAERKNLFTQLVRRTTYYIDTSGEREDEEEAGGDDASEKADRMDTLERVEKEQLIRGYKYGSSFVPVSEDAFANLKQVADTKAKKEGRSVEEEAPKEIAICGFFPAKNFRRELAMGEVQYIWGEPKSPRDQVALSSIVQAMAKSKVMAIARWSSSKSAEPKMGVLRASELEHVDCLLWVKMPFAEDVRKYNFASLERLVSKEGEVLTKHPYLPNEEQMEAMERFVDAMDLMDAGEKDEEGNRQPWFDTRLSYNPAVHRVKQAMLYGAVVEDLNTRPLPPPHPELTKYFEPPRRVLKRAHSAIEECERVFKVKEVPQKVARTRKDEHVHARDEDDEMILLDKVPGPGRTQSKAHLSPGKSPTQPSKPRKKVNEHDSATETEDEDEEDLLLDRKEFKAETAKEPQEPGEEQEQKPQPPPTPERSPSLPPDAGRAPGRIVGFAYPLEDFKKNIASGDLVTKAVEDLGWVIKEIVKQPFSGRRTDELLECMRELRKVSLEEDEIEAWNDFVRDLKKVCLEEKPGNRQFWDRVRELGRDVSLISKPEAERLGGTSDVSEGQAAEFLQS